MSDLTAIDLFAGLGGFSQAASLANVRVLWAANHWRPAVDFHLQNHPDTEHSCQDLHQANWEQVPRHDLLLASPCCQGHSKARGVNRPQHDKSRSTAWAVVSCAEFHKPPMVIVENVPEFLNWSLFPAWRLAMESLGYSLSINTFDAADAGVPQNRVRTFIVGTRSKSPLVIRPPSMPLVPASSIIDFSAGRWSKIDRDGRSEKTLQQIARGRDRFGNRFVIPYYGSGSGLTGRTLDRPIGTLTTIARWGIINGDRMRMLAVQECRMAMGFPDGYVVPRNVRLATHLLGNAVCPPAAAHVIREIRRAA